MIGRFFLLSAIRSLAGFVYEKIYSLRSQRFLLTWRDPTCSGNSYVLLPWYAPWIPISLLTGLGTNARGLRSWSGSQGMVGSLICAPTRSIAVAFRRFRAGIYDRDPSLANSIFIHEDWETQSAAGRQTYLERKRYWLVSRYLHRGLV